MRSLKKELFGESGIHSVPNFESILDGIDDQDNEALGLPRVERKGIVVVIAFFYRI